MVRNASWTSARRSQRVRPSQEGPELVQPGQRSLHYPPKGTQSPASRVSAKWVYNTSALDVAPRSASSPYGRGLR